MNRTPKTLTEAIRNGLAEVRTIVEFGGGADAGATVEKHVRDFLAQKFTVDVMDFPGAQDLWKRITEKERA